MVENGKSRNWKFCRKKIVDKFPSWSMSTSFPVNGNSSIFWNGNLWKFPISNFSQNSQELGISIFLHIWKFLGISIFTKNWNFHFFPLENFYTSSINWNFQNLENLRRKIFTLFPAIVNFNLWKFFTNLPIGKFLLFWELVKFIFFVELFFFTFYKFYDTI